MTVQLNASEEARKIISALKEEHGDVLFLISGGCCDGSAPLCFTQSEFRLGEGDVLLGYVDETAVYISDILRVQYSDPEQFFLDVEQGRGGGFSLEAPMGVRFINRVQHSSCHLM